MRYIALLRAINVGGRTVKMDRLRTLFEDLGLSEVQTYIASGNVIFESRANAASLEKRIEKHLARSLQFSVPTLVRSAPEFIRLADHQPFSGRPALPTLGALYVGFLKSRPAADAAKRVAALGDAANTFALNERELYWRADDRRSVLDIPIATFERVLGCEATFRNVTTVRKIADRYCRA
jgi:uncharacterized protein (DUF1697 family)